jgi:hypothetical protein
MAFVTSYTPLSSGSAFTAPAKSGTQSPLGIGAPRSRAAVKVSMSSMSSFSRRLIIGTSKDYTGTATRARRSFAPSGPYKPSLRSGPTALPKRYAESDAVVPRGARKADSYIAQCAAAQYRALANPAGVYATSCTEGAAAGQADEARELANLANMRQLQRSPLAAFADFTETRRVAITMAHGCSYEEKLVNSFPVAAKAVVRGYSEAKSLCVRYNNAASEAEKYMARCVDAQYKAKAAPSGVYSAMCADGNTAGLAEFKRVQAMSARFRANQMTAGAKAQARYDARKYARSVFRTCNYEEDVFNAFPAVASSMRPLTARY